MSVSGAADSERERERAFKTLLLYYGAIRKSKDTTRMRAFNKHTVTEMLTPGKTCTPVEICNENGGRAGWSCRESLF